LTTTIFHVSDFGLECWPTGVRNLALETLCCIPDSRLLSTNRDL